MKILHLNYELGTDVRDCAHGGIENFIYNLNELLVKRGYDSNVLARWDSKVTGLIPFEGNYVESPDFIKDEEFIAATNFRYCADVLNHALNGDFDIIHSHGRPISVFGDIIKTPIITTLHLPPEMFWRENLGDINNPKNKLVAISKRQKTLYEENGFDVDRVIYNGIPIRDDHPFRESHGKYLFYLGRMSEAKGPHIAIAVAKQMGLPLKLAGGYANSSQKAFFESRILPQIGDNIEYLGHVDRGKEELYAEAKCLLFPSMWEEPFGLTPIEANLTGTPVVCFDIGATPEVTINGLTGFLVEDVGNVNDMCKAVGRIDEINRVDCKENVIKRFSLDRMVSDYLQAYED